MKKQNYTVLTVIISLCMLFLLACAPSGGGRGSGSDEITFANITLGSGQYSGYYTMRSTIVSEDIRIHRYKCCHKPSREQSVCISF